MGLFSEMMDETAELSSRIEELEGQLKALRAVAVKVLGACDQPLALEVSLVELERVVRATPLT
jgi:hypothetical protein